MAPRYCPIDGKPWGTCTSADYAPPLPVVPADAATDDDEIERRRIVPSPLDPRVRTVFVNRPAQLPTE